MYPEQVSIVKYEEVAKKPKTTLPILLKVKKEKNKIKYAKWKPSRVLVIFHCSSLASPGIPHLQSSWLIIWWRTLSKTPITFCEEIRN